MLAQRRTGLVLRALVPSFAELQVSPLTGLSLTLIHFPTPAGVGYVLSPLRGFNSCQARHEIFAQAHTQACLSHQP